MAMRMRSYVRCLVHLVLPFLFFASLLYQSTRQPLLDVAVSDITAVATEGAEGNVLTDAPLASGDANVTTNKDGESKVVTNAPPASAAAEPDSDITTTASTAGSSTNGDADTIVFDFRPYVFVYKSERVHRFHGTETVPPGVDALTGVASTDVAGANGVGVRLYLLPKNHRMGRRGKKKKNKKLPVLLYFHGGAFVIESPFSPPYHAFLNILVAKAGIVAVSVDYHLAPEHPLPAAYHDAWAALWWMASNCISRPKALLADHGDAMHIFLAGDSAGGNITHNLAPGGASRTGAPAARRRGHRRCRPPDPVLLGQGSGGYGIDDPHVNPLAALGAWRGMAGERVLVTIAGRDNFWDRAVAYVEGLRRNGWRGEVETYVTEGVARMHFLGNPRSEKAERETDKVAEFIAGGGRVAVARPCSSIFLGHVWYHG
ncbi:unnamed protein product [Miscanthus lutarioriparius]|uniref:Alpha/beta hydrolase fold-3 domain-containing protein n=1 Tax=Miscanthus lutarioriparius TaxID=422564 RepID=A0A811S7E6_9POAL|nr:unnamed protein product [Miscanthus lutarioriparius]